MLPDELLNGGPVYVIEGELLPESDRPSREPRHDPFRVIVPAVPAMTTALLSPFTCTLVTEGVHGW